ncbi:MAG: fasciclin domain-containing protein [Thermosynechococcaceae cyanobacterium]
MTIDRRKHLSGSMVVSFFLLSLTSVPALAGMSPSKALSPSALKGNCERLPLQSGNVSLIAQAAPAGNIVDIASASGSFKVLTKALQETGLDKTLAGDGPFTVFAPTDDAFAKLPPGTVETLLKPENKDKLTAILTYHVLSSKVVSGEIKPGSVPTVQGQPITIKVESGGVMVNDAKVVKADIEASNGVIHVIDQVILPPST